MKSGKKAGRLTILLIFISHWSCYEFNSLQTARLLSKNEINIMPDYCSMYYTYKERYKHISNNIGFQLGYGFSNSYNAIIRYSRIRFSEYDVGYNYLNIDSKFCLIKNRIAISAPVGLYFGRAVDFTESVNVQPTIYLTFQLNRFLDVTVAPKYIIYIPSLEGLGAVNANLAIHFFGRKITLIPEIGFACTPDLQDRFGYWSIGIAYQQPLSL